jgi:ribosomal protein L7/L12
MRINIFNFYIEINIKIKFNEISNIKKWVKETKIKEKENYFYPKIYCVKKYKEKYNVSLFEAKTAIDNFEKKYNIKLTPKTTIL